MITARETEADEMKHPALRQWSGHMAFLFRNDHSPRLSIQAAKAC
jgi:hypothetical protein